MSYRFKVIADNCSILDENWSLGIFEPPLGQHTLFILGSLESSW